VRDLVVGRSPVGRDMIRTYPVRPPAPVPAAGAHGGDARLVAAALGLDPDEILDLSASLNPFAPDPGPAVGAAIAGGALARYPDRADAARATGALAEVLSVDERRVLLTNGGSEAIALVAGELERGWVEEPEFSLYQRHLRHLDPSGPRFRSDPHNPTGRLAGPDQTAAVWDEAFYPLATGRWTRSAATDASPDHRGVPSGPEPVVVGSVTKVLACPGLRIGYVVAPLDDGEGLGVPGFRDRLAARQPLWSVGTAALVALPGMLAGADIGGWAAAIGAAREEMCTVLRRAGLSPRPSDANFVLVDGAAGLRDRLARQGVVVRDCASFGLPGCVRIAVPDAAGLARLAAALERATDGTARAGGATDGTARPVNGAVR
jgi:histidinol-phosphate/aromatic aminotransferase/cobyric acid decarboxylase-like protein